MNAHIRKENQSICCVVSSMVFMNLLGVLKERVKWITVLQTTGLHTPNGLNDKFCIIYI